MCLIVFSYENLSTDLIREANIQLLWQVPVEAAVLLQASHVFKVFSAMLKPSRCFHDLEDCLNGFFSFVDTM